MLHSFSVLSLRGRSTIKQEYNQAVFNEIHNKGIYVFKTLRPYFLGQ